MLKGHEEDEAVAYILDEIEKESFLPKQRSSANGTIPNQVHAKEMKKILANAEVFLPFLSDVDASGLTVAERILRLFSFHLPYYVGPVSENSKTGWVVRKEAGPVLPWNMEEKIDMAETSKKFIENLIRTCTYLEDEKVLPKNSLLYERYRALNEINNLRIDGERLTVEQKQEFYRDKIQKGKRLTKKAVAQYFHVLPEQISGIDERINNVASSYKKFYDIFGEEMKTDQTREMVETIIEYATIYGDDKKMLRKKLSEQYPHLEDAVLKRVCGMKFKDWGRLSKELLLLRGCDKETGEIYSLIQAMWEENLNFMELINSKDFTFRDELAKKCAKNNRSLAEITYEDLDGKYLSAPVKRMVWQTLLLLKEIEKIMGCPPARVFVEVTREDEVKKERKQSRKDQLLELYKKIKSETKDWVKELEALDEGQLRSKKLYLYYTQMGKDMYTGKPIDLDQLFNDNLYDIDHIYPRHFVKDDSIHNNLVLVDKRENTKKSDAYPLEDRIQRRCKSLWKTLLDNRLINEEKYKRLTQKENIFENDEIRAGFIARQLVETSQANKAVADLLKQALPESKIVYSKARNISDFRRGENGSGRRITDADGKNKLVGVVKFPKSRVVNDLHHAHDAYLNIVVGNVYYSKFEGDPKQFIIKKYNADRKKYDYNLNRMFSFDLPGAWVRGEEGTIATVRKMLAKTSPLFTRMTFEQHGALSKEQPVSAKDAKNNVSYLPLKTTDARLTDRTRYGGYQKVKNAYFFLVEHTKGKKRIRTIETLPIHRKKELDQNPEALRAYCRETLGLRDPEIRLAKIKPQSLIRYNGFLVQISNKSGAQFNVRNANNLFLPADWVEYICDLEKGKTETCSPERNLALYDLLTDKHSTGIFAKRLNAVGGMLQKGRAKFIGLEPAEQRRVLLEILRLSAIGLTRANLTAIGGSPNSGVMSISNNLSNAQEFLLIHQSVTGVYEKTVDLKKI